MNTSSYSGKQVWLVTPEGEYVARHGGLTKEAEDAAIFDYDMDEVARRVRKVEEQFGFCYGIKEVRTLE